MSLRPDVEIGEVDLSPGLVDRALEGNAEIVVLPIDDGSDEAVYTEASTTIVKELRSAGIDAKYLDPPEERSFEIKRSHLDGAVQVLLLGIASNASWDALRTLLLTRSARRLSVTYVSLDLAPGRRGTVWRVRGDSHAVVEALGRLLGAGEHGTTEEE